ncbi:bacterial Ig-like domain-containing protein [Lederbergia citri]|uniref:Bacterial Ig-like domain-containing protein n=1 Tax=Lederbergia citri TaxID=2833580 RepID=A0A942TC95_9BACI|nr:bacterial Ig-like domain-containing protein [Lederbergia citri]MBS4195135.1 bacterial Ig-like domain-containing protein [Lederbergia citri]
MKKCKKLLSLFMVFLLLIPHFHLNVKAESEWTFRAFGSNTNKTNNPEPIIQDDGAIQIKALGGKISSTVDGLSFYYQALPANANFELRATAKAESFGANNQVSFGLMLRDEVGEHWSSSGHESNYVAVGAIDQEIKGFYKQEVQTKLPPFDPTIPSAGDEYDFSIKKSGDTYVVSVNGEVSKPFTLDNIFQDEFYAGIYAARDTIVTFHNVSLDVDNRIVKSLNVDSSKMKTEYLQGEELDLTGLQVSAEYLDGTTEMLDETDYIVTGFDSSTMGPNTITIHYNGITAQLELTIVSLKVTNLFIKYLPAKTDYYIGDYLDSEGLVVMAEYNDGYQVAKLEKDQYEVSVAGEKVSEEGYAFKTAGTIPVSIISTETPDQTTSFKVNVNNAELTNLEVRKAPAKMKYFLGEELNLTGMNVYAHYNDGSEVRLMKNEYKVSGFDSESIGENELTVSHKGKTTTFSVEVIEKEISGLEVTDYPKTTYLVGEEFDTSGLVVSKVYTNSERVPLEETDYILDTSQFNSKSTGTYTISIVPADDTLKSISFQVTVREENIPEWKQIRFGQSSSNARNYIEKLEDGAIKLVAEEGGGKVTGDHDGITFYYTELDAKEDNFVLSGDIKVIEYAKTPYDGQESFGIMARDAIGPANDSGVFASNIAAIGGFSGGTREDNGTQLFVRTGVLNSDGEGSQGIQKRMLKNERPNASNTAENYRLTLAKTNSGFIGKLNNEAEEIIFEPDILDVQDGKMYIGFFTARLATIEVRNIEFSVTSAKTDPPRVLPPSEPIMPEIEILSLDKTSDTKYSFMVRANVGGTIIIKENQKMVAENTEIKSGQILELMTELPANKNTNFSITFLPDDTQLLTDYSKIIRNFTVVNKTFKEDGDIYIEPNGTASGDGSKEHPLDLDTAIDFVMKGQKIIVQEGHYVRKSPLEIKKYNDGTKEDMKYLIADPDAKTRPLIDFDKKSEGVIHNGSYWHVEGIDFARSAGNTKGYTIGGSHNEIVNISTFENGDTGLQISRTDDDPDKSKWPSHNLIINSISFDNRDPSENNADGFAAKLTSGEGNIFRGTIAFNNIDDGWDLYTKVGTGAIGAVTIENSIAFNNGRLSNGYEGSGDKNGFKLGGEGIHVPHVIRNSIAFGNGAYGFTSNSNPGVIAENNISFNNDGANLSFTTYNHIPTDFTIDGFASIRTSGKVKDSYPQASISDKNYFFNGTESINGEGEILPTAILDSLNQIFNYDEEGNIVSVKRDVNGNIQWGDLWDTFERVIEPKVNLEKLIKEANSIKNKGMYTGTSYAALQKAINNAEKAIKKIKAKEDLRVEINKLQAAIDDLEKRK